MRSNLLLLPALAALIGCGPVITLHHRSAPDADCGVDPGAGAGPGLLDVASERGYVGLLAASSPVAVTLETAVIYAEQGGEPIAGLPTTETSRWSTVGGLVRGEPSVVPVRLITSQEADIIEAGALGSTLQTPDDRATLSVTTTLAGGAYSSNELTIELQLCRGCLLPACSVDEVYGGVCFPGQDEGATCVEN